MKRSSQVTLLTLLLCLIAFCQLQAQPNSDPFGLRQPIKIRPEKSREPAAVAVQTAKGMADDKAYEYLRDWVIPEANKPDFQMQFEIMPLDDQQNLTPETAEVDRFLSPAIQLIAIAKKLNKLDELLERVNAVDASSSQDTRAKASLLTLIYAEQNKMDLAKAEIEKLSVLAERPLPSEMSVESRAPEFYVVLYAGRKLPLYVDAYLLGTTLRAHERNMATHASDWNWVRLLNGALSAVNRKHMGETVVKPLKQWTSVPNVTAIQSAQGMRPSVWRMEKGTLRHDGGEAWSSLYFQSPLRGKFEIVANRSTYNYGEMLVSIGMHSAEPLFDLKARRVHRALLGTIIVGDPVEMPVWDYMAEFRIVVDDNKVTTYTNGVFIHEQQFDAPIDPWLVLQAEWPESPKVVKSIDIIGTPEIPTEIDLVHMADAGGWRVNFYEYSSYANPVGRYYAFTPDEIHGRLQVGSGSRKRESFLKYSRPMLEDGEFEYEFFYEKDSFEAHPVIGKTAFMLSDEAVQVHPLTNGFSDQSGNTPDTLQELAGAKKPTLKPGTWNHVLVKLKGDSVTLSVNGEEVATRAVAEPANERFFGFFRYVSHYQMRIRNAKYRGDWPKELPPLEMQELADKS